MTDPLKDRVDVSLGACLHDGDLLEITSDLLARTLTLAVDSRFHWDFHKLSSETRFKVVGENVRIVEVLNFEAWPDAKEPPGDMPWTEAQEQRQRDYKKGRLVSDDWAAFIAQFDASGDCEIVDAELSNGEPLSILTLGIVSCPSAYRTVKVHAERFRFFVGEREFSLREFQDFGAAYWDDWSKTAESSGAERNNDV